MGIAASGEARTGREGVTVAGRGSFRPVDGYDVTYLTIRLLRLFGLAWDVVTPAERPERT
jgi:hypothetical protein